MYVYKNEYPDPVVTLVRLFMYVSISLSLPPPPDIHDGYKLPPMQRISEQDLPGWIHSKSRGSSESMMLLLVSNFHWKVQVILMCFIHKTTALFMTQHAPTCFNPIPTHVHCIVLLH